MSKCTNNAAAIWDNQPIKSQVTPLCQTSFSAGSWYVIIIEQNGKGDGNICPIVSFKPPATNCCKCKNVPEAATDVSLVFKNFFLLLLTTGNSKVAHIHELLMVIIIAQMRFSDLNPLHNVARTHWERSNRERRNISNSEQKNKAPQTSLCVLQLEETQNGGKYYMT